MPKTILNLSKTRKHTAEGPKSGKKDDKGDLLPGKPVDILPNKAEEVSDEAAEFLLGKSPSGQPRYPELVDAAKYVPSIGKAKELEAENAELLKKNAELQKQIDALGKKAEEEDKGDKGSGKGGKK